MKTTSLMISTIVVIPIVIRSITSTLQGILNVRGSWLDNDIKKMTQMRLRTELQSASCRTPSKASFSAFSRGLLAESFRSLPTLLLSSAVPAWMVWADTPVCNFSVLIFVFNGVLFSAGVSVILVGMLQRWLRGDFHDMSTGE